MAIFCRWLAARDKGNGRAGNCPALFWSKAMTVPYRVVPPAALPVSLSDAKAHLIVDHGDHDALIERQIAAATDMLDGYHGKLHRALVRQTWQVDLPGVPPGGVIRLPLGPAISVDSIMYRDRAGAVQTLPAADYSGPVLDGLGPFVRVRSRPDLGPWDDAVMVRFTCGAGAPEDVPALIRQAILLLVGHWYAQREAAGDSLVEVPLAVSAIIAQFVRPL